MPYYIAEHWAKGYYNKEPELMSETTIFADDFGQAKQQATKHLTVGNWKGRWRTAENGFIKPKYNSAKKQAMYEEEIRLYLKREPERKLKRLTREEMASIRGSGFIIRERANRINLITIAMNKEERAEQINDLLNEITQEVNKIKEEIHE